MVERNTVNVPLIATLGAVSGVLLVVIVVGVQAWYIWTKDRQTARTREGFQPQPLTNLRAGQKAQLKGFRWVDREKQIVGVPIDMAMAEVVRRGGGASPRASAK